MSNTISITASKREVKGSAASRRLRGAGQIPAVVYSRGAENLLLQVASAEVEKIQHHAGLVAINDANDGITKQAIIKEIQRNPLNGKFLCIDFLEVKAGEKVTMPIPVEPVGEPEGIKQGGQLEQVIHQLEITAEPANLPEVIKVDVSKLEVNQALTIADIKLDNATIEGDAKLIVFHVRIPHNKVEEPAPAEAAPADAAAAPAADDAKKEPAKKEPAKK